MFDTHPDPQSCCVDARADVLTGPSVNSEGIKSKKRTRKLCSNRNSAEKEEEIRGLKCKQQRTQGSQQEKINDRDSIMSRQQSRSREHGLVKKTRADAVTRDIEIGENTIARDLAETSKVDREAEAGAAEGV